MSAPTFFNNVVSTRNECIPVSSTPHRHTEDCAEMRLLQTLEAILSLDDSDLQAALSQAATLISAALDIEKVDVFFFDPSHMTLVVQGLSSTEMGRHQIEIGMDRLPLANGGRIVEVYQTGKTYHTGHADQDPEVLLGFTQGLGIRSILAVALDVAGERRGVLQAASARPDAFADRDVTFLESVVRWLGMLIQRAESLAQLEQQAVVQGRRMAAEELVTIMAHDLRNYLAPLQTRLALLQRSVQKKQWPQVGIHAGDLEQLVQRFVHIIDDVLDIGRLEAGLFSLQLQSVHLTELLTQIQHDFTAPTTPITLLAPEDVLLTADPNRLRQAIENVVANAIKHTPPNTPITLQVSQQVRDGQSWVLIDVQDQGQGIPPEVLPHIFERFRTGDPAAGLGMGLYLAYQIMLAHHGTITVASMAASGTRFTFALPLDNPHADQ